ncbi:Serpentine Receptor, class H [Caenorhabditis elegans]|uniref:Serpentine Receptor, class H n=1 Tax=Caenorhabditis elegans TaxID=6239 RepID=O17292_CAEEL|nr:Serpentine Receptor, class H [Caenorhabditis elegans]CCD67117.1 Serpentine Receptor, class H [Caenorhabditis elegans]|eukprot:NP_494186.1 Serpentine Receptor, class H [Caenorhabditis elegans]
MHNSCRFTYFDSPEFLTLAFHTTSLIETPIHCLGFYCILWKTPEQMKSVKWYMFTLHTWILLFDYSLSLLTAPFVLVNEGAGYPLGLSKYTNVPEVFQFMIVIDFATNMAISIDSIFENRFYIICTFSWKHHWKFWRRVWLAAHYILLIVLLSVIPFLVPDQNIAVKKLFQNIPCLPKHFLEAPIFVVADDKTYHMIAAVFHIALICFEVFLFVVFLIRNSAKQLKEKTMSQKTFELQKRFFIALVIQISIPLACFIFPLAFAAFSVIIGYSNQAVTNVLVVTIASHGIVSTIAMLLLHKPYRNAVKEIWNRPFGKSADVSQNQGRNLFIAPRV